MKKLITLLVFTMLSVNLTGCVTTTINNQSDYIDSNESSFSENVNNKNNEHQEPFDKNSSDIASKYDISVKIGMSKKQVDDLWGKPFKNIVKQENNRKILECYYYDNNNELRIVFYTDNIVGAISPDYYKLSFYLD